MAYQQDIRTSTLALIGGLGVLVTLAIVLLLVVLYYRTADRLEYERYISQPFVERDDAVAKQQVRLVEYEKLGSVEEEGQTKIVYRIPIEEAIKGVLKDWKNGVLPGAPPKPQPFSDGQADAQETAVEDADEPEKVDAAVPEKAEDASPASGEAGEEGSDGTSH